MSITSNLSYAADKILDLKFQEMMEFAGRLSTVFADCELDPSDSNDVAKALVTMAEGIDEEYREQLAEARRARESA